MIRRASGLLPALVASCLAMLLVAGCASLAGQDPLEVTVAGIEPMPGEGLELRMVVKLRIQNPNDTPVDYDGVSLALDVQGSTFATGVSDASGTVPRFGEAVVQVPVTTSALRMARQVLGMADGAPVDRLAYDLRGKLSGSGFATHRFRTEGELTLAR